MPKYHAKAEERLTKTLDTFSRRLIKQTESTASSRGHNEVQTVDVEHAEDVVFDRMRKDRLSQGIVFICQTLFGLSLSLIYETIDKTNTSGTYMITGQTLIAVVGLVIFGGLMLMVSIILLK